MPSNDYEMSRSDTVQPRPQLATIAALARVRPASPRQRVEPVDPAPATLSLPEFQARWRNTSLSDRATAQSHFVDLCALVRYPAPYSGQIPADDYAFERRVRKLDGKMGFADVWRRGLFAWEYKRPGANLDEAYRQIRYYRDDLDNPPLLVVTDINRIIVHTNITNYPDPAHVITLEGLSEPNSFKKLRDVFHDPWALRAEDTVEAVTEKAASEFASLAATLESGCKPMGFRTRWTR